MITNDNDASGEDPATQAAHWYARLKSLPVSASTLEQFFAWRKIDANRDAFEAVDRFYTEAGAIADRPPISAAVEQALARNAGLASAGWGRRNAVAAAAIGLAVIAVTTIGMWLPRGEQYVTAIGERRSVRLADGSKIMLDTDTRLSVVLASDARRISLMRGQAYFEVAHDAARPFTVDAGGTTVLATGTEFDVHRRDDRVDVTLVKGSVQVSADDHPVAQLGAGQGLAIEGNQATPVRKVDTAPALAWMQGRIVLDGMTLANAVTEVNRYVKTPIALDAPSLADTKISGTVDAGDAASFVKAVTAILPLKAQTNNDGSVTLRS